MGRTLVGRATPDDLTGAREREVMAWLDRLGLAPVDRFVRQLAVTQTGDDGYELHLTEQLHDEQGHRFLDWAAQTPAQRPLVVPVPAGSWPAWLTGMHVLT